MIRYRNEVADAAAAAAAKLREGREREEVFAS